MTGIVRRATPDLRPVHKPFPYQLEAYEAIKDLEYAAVLHEQGLGKTKIAIDAALHWLEQDVVDSVIVVTKKGLVGNWLKEFKIHTNIKPKLITGDRNSNHYAFHSPAAFFLTHYEAIKVEEKRVNLFLKSRRVGMVLDEAHKIKNPSAAVTGAFHAIAPLLKKRIILTGSPIANRPYDLWSQIWFLDQGRALGTDFTTFRKKLDIPRDPDEDGNAIDIFEDQLGDLFPRIRDFSVRETKKNAGIHLPGKHYRLIEADWESNQLEMYKRVRDEMRIEVEKEGLLTEDVSEDLLKRLLRLVQISSNPALVDERYRGEPGKVAKLREIVDEVVAAGQKLIVWTSFVDNVGWIAKLFESCKPVRLHGRMSIADREVSIDKFIEDESVKVMVATPQAAKEGLTLTVANHVVFYDRTFSLDDYIQAQDRIHRISQERECYIYNLLMNDSIDYWADTLIGAKQVAAHYGQGDIKYEQYRREMRYDISAELRAVLGIDDDFGG